MFIFNKGKALRKAEEDTLVSQTSERKNNGKEANTSFNETKQDALIKEIRRKMLTESDVRRIVAEELRKLLAKEDGEESPTMKIIAENNAIEIVEQTENEESPTRIPFPIKMLEADDELKQCYNELKAEALAYGLKSRLSNSGDTFRLHTKTYLKITVVGKFIKCYFALDPVDYRDTSMPITDAGIKNVYKDIPLAFKVRSPLSLRRAKQLLSDACKRDNINIGETIDRDWVTPLKDYEPQLSRKAEY